MMRHHPISAVVLVLGAASAFPQDAPDSDGFPGTPIGHIPRVEIPWNRLYDLPELYGHFDRLVETWPEMISMQVIGHSVESREMRVYTVNNPASGPADGKPAMWVDGNVHGNEVQGGEAALYLAWYLLENHGSNEAITELLYNSAFYILPTVNPDGRVHWFRTAHSPHSSRTGVFPTDNDRDGLTDEDGPDDLDGDGHIVQMRKYTPGEGTHRLNADDERLMERVPTNDRGIRGDWTLLGSEGIDNDGDGYINEDGVGGYDMNRSWPSLWMPEHIQYGAGPYPLYWPETRCIARFLYEHPNVAAVQSFHNSGGMILRGPGAKSFGAYPARDLRAFHELGRDGEKMLPFYRYMVIWKDLYTVFGGFATWTYEGLGIISFTNELWTQDRMFPDEGERQEGGWAWEGNTKRADRRWFDDHLLMGSGYIAWHAAEHPLYGDIEIGGFRKDVGRVPPTFLIEEMVHRNALFCIKHAGAMPLVRLVSLEAEDLGDGLIAVDARFRNEHVIPTRTEISAQRHIGTPDVFAISGDGIEVLAGGLRDDRWRPNQMDLEEHEPQRILSETGIDGRRETRIRWFLRGSGTVTVSWRGEKGRNVEGSLELP
jgi:hypothetical protein